MSKVGVPTLACLALLAAAGTQLAGCADSRPSTAQYPSSSTAPAAQPGTTTTENVPAQGSTQGSTWSTWQPGWMAPRVVGSGEK